MEVNGSVLALGFDRLQGFEWANLLAQSDAAVAADREAGFTTLVGLCVIGDRVAGASAEIEG